MSDEFMAEVRGMEHQNLAVELLQKLLKDEIKTSSCNNIVQSRKLADLLEDALRHYRNQVISVTDILFVAIAQWLAVMTFLAVCLRQR